MSLQEQLLDQANRLHRESVALHSLMLALTACCEALILLSPPAHHYGYYDSKRSAIYSFVNTFFEAAAGAGEQLYVIADNRTRRDLSAEYGLNDAIVGVLDDIWIRDFFVTQLSDTTLVRFGYRPMYLNQQEISWIDHSARRFVEQIWPRGEVSLLSGNGPYPSQTPPPSRSSRHAWLPPLATM